MRLALIAIAVLLALAVVVGAVGVAMLAGIGWTLVFLAGCCVGLALVIARGVTSGV